MFWAEAGITNNAASNAKIAAKVFTDRLPQTGFEAYTLAQVAYKPLTAGSRLAHARDRQPHEA